VRLRSGSIQCADAACACSAVEQKYNAPIWVVHRADLQRCLVNAGARAGVALHTGARVVEIDMAGASPRIRVQQRGEDGAGAWVDADVVIAADGIRSPARAAMMQKQGAVDEGLRVRLRAARTVLILAEQWRRRATLPIVSRGSLPRGGD
jgi:salicylate hydroxylase